MKRSLVVVLMCGAALAGCTRDDGELMSVSDGVNSDYQDIKAVTKATSAAVKAQAAEAEVHADNFGDSAKTGFYQAVDHMADWMRPSVPKPPQPIASSYCYHVYQDILCYRRAMPGWEEHLAGYQPLDTKPPAPAMMKPLPVHAVDTRQLPANRVANAKPVFKEMPAPLAAPEKPVEDAAVPVPAVPDATHEQLPDPALAPQL